MLFKPQVTLTSDIDNASTSSLVRARGVLHITDYTGILGPKGVGFSVFRYIKGLLKLRIRYEKGLNVRQLGVKTGIMLGAFNESGC